MRGTCHLRVQGTGTGKKGFMVQGSEGTRKTDERGKWIIVRRGGRGGSDGRADWQPHSVSRALQDWKVDWRQASVPRWMQGGETD